MCPQCGFEKNIICPVCGIEKEAGAICKTCGSEYSHTSCPECKYCESHLEPLNIENYEKKLRVVLKTRDPKYLTYYEFIRLSALYTPHLLEKICINDPIDIKNKTQAAFKSDSPKTLGILTKIKGVNKELAELIIEKYMDTRI